MSATFTAGPWYWHADSYGNISLRTPDRGNLIVMDFVRKGVRSGVPRFAKWPHMDQIPRDRLGGIMHEGTDHPDARLIAAAPDLYAALKLTLAELEAYELPTDPMHPQRVAVEAARAALAKVES